MKKITLIIACMLTASLGFSQQSWKIVLHKKLLLTSSESNETVNIKTVRSADWKKSGYLEITYAETPASIMRHSISFTDERGNELLVKDSVLSTKVSTTSLRKLFAGKKQVKIYMVLSPPNPMMAMASRSIHLATLKLP